MKDCFSRVMVARLLVGVASMGMASASAWAQSPDEGAVASAEGESIVVTGTRRTDRTAADSLAPIDIVSSRALESVPSGDLNDKLARLVPSFAVQRNTIANGNIFFRTATLRNLSADHTLVLVNGKRRHRSAFVDVTQLGAQAADISQIPSIALQRVEVLRDGASAQYGSDAIAGVINFIPDDRPGLRAYAQAGQYYAGDGENYQAGINAGLPFTDRGTVNISLEYNDGARTSRSVQAASAQSLIDNGGRFGSADFYRQNIRNPVERFGQPEQKNYRSFVNLKLDLDDSTSFYSFGSYSYAEGESDFIWRNPETSTYFNPLPIWGDYTLRTVYPGGFAPHFGMTSKDADFVAGLKGALSNDLTWDLSGRYGRNFLRFKIDNTINASLGPDSPTRFDAGSKTQSEYGANLDLVYRPDVGLASPLTVGFGGEYRNEEYSSGIGDAASYALGPGAAFGYPGGSNGFFGTDPTQAGTFGRHSVAAYLDVDAQVSEAWEIDAAGRFEDYSDAGSAWTGKLATRYDIGHGIAFRGAVSTGFRAPTPGQANLTNTSQRPAADGRSILTQGTIPATNTVALLRGGTPLKPERSVNLSGGVTFAIARGATFSVDYYNIRIKDRLGLSANFTLTPQERSELVASGITLAQGLDTFNFYVNGFKTRTQGVDAILAYQFPVAQDTDVGLTLLYNYNQTKVIGAAPGVVSPLIRQSLEDRLPHHKASASLDVTHGPLSGLLRGTYYSGWTQPFFDNVAQNQRFGSEIFLDASLTYAITSTLKGTVGVENFLGNYPAREVGLAAFGAKYPLYRPYEADGGRYYLRLSFSL